MRCHMEVAVSGQKNPTTFIRCFTPSLNRVPAELLAEAGAASSLLGDLALRRTWSVGGAVYQPLAVRTLLGDDFVDLMVRRKDTLEPAVVLSEGSPLAALQRALAQLRQLRQPA